jgi:6-pyruvoyltetrahydropterin/6-carboxytetrahydropterin synthase
MGATESPSGTDQSRLTTRVEAVMITATRVFNFCYGHKLPNYVGKCSNLHGHNADLEVTVKGPPCYEYLKQFMSKEQAASDSIRGKVYPTMIDDFSGIKAVVEREAIKFLDHSYLNEFFDPNPPTAEVMSLWIWKQLYEAYRFNLVRIRLSEGPNSWITVETGPSTSELVREIFKEDKDAHT